GGWRRPAWGEGHDVVELKEAALSAAALLANKGAAAAIALTDGAAHCRRYVPRTHFQGAGAPRPLDLCQPLLLQVGDQQCQRAVEDLADVAARQLMAQQILSATKLQLHLGP